MRELAPQNLIEVKGGIIWPLAWKAVSATVVASDAASSSIDGFKEGFDRKKAELKQKNGWT